MCIRDRSCSGGWKTSWFYDVPGTSRSVARHHLFKFCSYQIKVISFFLVETKSYGTNILNTLFVWKFHLKSQCDHYASFIIRFYSNLDCESKILTKMLFFEEGWICLKQESFSSNTCSKSSSKIYQKFIKHCYPNYKAS